jgi:hypothetical protein
LAAGADNRYRITLGRLPFTVTGIAVSAANVPYPQADFDTYGGPFPTGEFGMMWLTEPDATSLVTKALPVSYLLNLKLASPAAARAFGAGHGHGRFSVLALPAWQDIAREDSNLVLTERRALVFGSSLLALLAVASVTVLVGGRMAEQTRRVGLLKAIGATPKLVAAVLLAQNLMTALAAAAAGLAAGWLAAPVLTRPGAGLVGSAGTPSPGPCTRRDRRAGQRRAVGGVAAAGARRRAGRHPGRRRADRSCQSWRHDHRSACRSACRSRARDTARARLAHCHPGPHRH